VKPGSVTRCSELHFLADPADPGSAGYSHQYVCESFNFVWRSSRQLRHTAGLIIVPVIPWESPAARGPSSNCQFLPRCFDV